MRIQNWFMLFAYVGQCLCQFNLTSDLKQTFKHLLSPQKNPRNEFGLIFNWGTCCWQTRDSSKVRLTTLRAPSEATPRDWKCLSSHLEVSSNCLATNSDEARYPKLLFSPTNPSFLRSNSYLVVTYPPPLAKKFLARVARTQLFPRRLLCLMYGCIFDLKSGHGHSSKRIFSFESVRASWLHKWTKRFTTLKNMSQCIFSTRRQRSDISKVPTSMLSPSSLKVLVRFFHLRRVD